MSNINQMSTTLPIQLGHYFPTAHPAFLSTMEAQLTVDFFRKTGHDFKAHLHLVTTYEENAPIQIKVHQQISWIDFELVWLGLGTTARIAWYSPTSSSPIPIDVAPSADIVFWWDYLDLEGLEERWQWWHTPSPNPLAGRFPYPLEWKVKIGLDWRIRLRSAPGHGDKLTQFLVDRQMEYNDESNNDRFGGIIHNLGEAIEDPAGTYTWTMDAGSAGHEGLAYLLEGLDFVPELVVVEMV